MAPCCCAGLCYDAGCLVTVSGCSWLFILDPDSALLFGKSSVCGPLITLKFWPVFATLLPGLEHCARVTVALDKEGLRLWQDSLSQAFLLLQLPVRATVPVSRAIAG